jgi:D-alanyl-D-alanine carboxypeptidase
MIAEKLEQAIHTAAADPAVPGVLAAVHAPGLGLAWQGATPHQLMDGSTGHSPETPFRLASTTKMVVACAVFRLIEQGRLGLHDPIIGMIDPAIAEQLRGGGFDPERIVLAHLLGHTSGLRDHVAEPSYAAAVMAAPQRRWSRGEQIALALAAGPPLGLPGTWFRYSDTGYVILGDIIERATGQRLGPAVRGLIGYEALGLAATWWEEDEPAPPAALQRAAQYMADNEASGHDPSFDLFGGGGLISTVGDLAHLTRALALGEVFDRPATLAAAYLISPATRAPEAFFVHSNAFMLFPVGARFGWGHAGFWGCVGVCLPDRDITIAATINQARPQAPDRMFTLVADLLAAIEG